MVTIDNQVNGAPHSRVVPVGALGVSQVQATDSTTKRLDGKIGRKGGERAGECQKWTGTMGGREITMLGKNRLGDTERKEAPRCVVGEWNMPRRQGVIAVRIKPCSLRHVCTSAMQEMQRDGADEEPTGKEMQGWLTLALAPSFSETRFFSLGVRPVSSAICGCCGSNILHLSRHKLLQLQVAACNS